MDSKVPRTSWKSKPVARMLLALSWLFSELNCAVYFIVAESTPQFLNSMMKFGAVKTIANMPYSEGERSLVTSTSPRAEIIAEAVMPQKRLNPPLAEFLAIPTDFFNGFPCFLDCDSKSLAI